MIILLPILALMIFNFNKVNNNDSLEFSLDKNGEYTGFSKLPTNYTIQDAKYDGCVVIQGLKVVANENVWDNFIKTALRKENIGIRIVEGSFFLDLFYNDGYYYLFDSSSKNQEKQPFLYLLVLEGKCGNPLRDSAVIVLTNDNTLTFDMVWKALISSSLVVINSIPSFKIVMFK